MTTSVVGTSPISYTDTNGMQCSVPLEALDFNGSTLEIASAWQSVLAADIPRILRLAQARVAIGDLAPPATPAPSPALALTATHQGTETNGITVTVASDPTKPPLTAPITVSATETDTYAGLANGTAAAQAIGDDSTAAKSPGDPPTGTGLVRVKQGTTGVSTKIPVASTSTLNKAGSVDLKDTDGNVVCTLVPRPDYAGTAGIALKVSVDASGQTFTITATYDSKSESTLPATVTLTTLGSLPASVGYLVAISAPSTGAHIPDDSTATLSGGGPGVAANALLYS